MENNFNYSPCFYLERKDVYLSQGTLLADSQLYYLCCLHFPVKNANNFKKKKIMEKTNRKCNSLCM